MEINDCEIALHETPHLLLELPMNINLRRMWIAAVNRKSLNHKRVQIIDNVKGYVKMSL